jgi:hypothetical protein
VSKLRISLLSGFLPALLISAVAAPAASAQDNKYPTIERARVGLEYGSGDVEIGHARVGSWTPVYVKLRTGAQGFAPQTHRLVVESLDNEDSTYRYVTSLPGIEPESDYFAITYARPGSTEIKLSLQTAAGKVVPVQVRNTDGRTLLKNEITREFGHAELQPRSISYLALGSRQLPGLPRSRSDATAPAEADVPADEGVWGRGERKLSYIDDARDLPDRWFGYDAADVIVLTTSNREFILKFLQDRAARTALGEWVRRGGKLVVGVGVNRQDVAELLDKLPLSESDKQPLLNCAIDGTVASKAPNGLPLRVFSRWASVGREPLPVLELSLTHLRPNAAPEAEAKPEAVVALIREAPTADDKDGPPVVVHAGCGLGRVVLLGFDPETTPFSTWQGQKSFWDKLETELQPRPAVVNSRFAGWSNDRQEVELGGELKQAMESFQEVPVVSFGWVALFILVYIVIVGPLDYLILKKVFKRLELTWITFPTAVIVISVAAYFTAYSLKGNDLRINKIDVVDFDLHGRTPQAYGSTWVTLFSPRIENYTIGVEPAWASPASKDSRSSGPLVTVMDNSDMMNGRMGSQSLFHRNYDYAPDGAGLINVAIPVWSMRTFSARWRSPLAQAETPIEITIRHPRDKNDPSLIGRITNHLPVDVVGGTLVYKGNAYTVPTISAGTSLSIDDLKVGALGKKVTDWITNPGNMATASSRTVTDPKLFRDLLFNSLATQNQKLNSGWRSLDQSWRLRDLVETSSRPQPRSIFSDEVVLIARVPSRADHSETVTAANASPTRLWIGALPDGEAGRPQLNGFLVQDVYIRVYTPVLP